MPDAARSRTQPRWTLGLALAVATLVVNDYVLKGASLVPGWLTGKLSDFAGLIVAGALLSLALRRWFRPRTAVSLACTLLGATFSALKLNAHVAASYDAVLASVAARLGAVVSVRTALDPSDLLALSVLPVGGAIGVHLQPRRRLGSRCLLVAASLACMGSLPSHVTMAPHWGFAEPSADRQLLVLGDALLDVSIMRVSVEGSFELGVRAYAQAQPLAIELSQITAWLRRDLVRAKLSPGAAEVLHVPPRSAGAARVYFAVGGYEVNDSSDFEEVPTAVGFLTIPVRIGERWHFARPELSFESRLVGWFDRGRFEAPRVHPATVAEPSRSAP